MTILVFIYGLVSYIYPCFPLVAVACGLSVGFTPTGCVGATGCVVFIVVTGAADAPLDGACPPVIGVDDAGVSPPPGVPPPPPGVPPPPPPPPPSCSCGLYPLAPTVSLSVV